MSAEPFPDTLAHLIGNLTKPAERERFKRLNVSLEMCLNPAYGLITTDLTQTKPRPGDIKWLLKVLGRPSYLTPAGPVWHFQNNV